MFVGEAPGYYEDISGLPFVGPSGTLLNKMLRVMETTREDVYITNIVKCRPPDNRDPMPDEIAACLPALHAQIYVIKPKVIMAVGRYAVNTLIQAPKFEPITDLLDQDLLYHCPKSNISIPVQAIHHPAFVLRKSRVGDNQFVERNLLLMRKAYQRFLKDQPI